MKIYVASPWEQRDGARSLMRSLENAGHEITLDWTSHEMFEWRGDAEKRAIAAGWAEADIFAVSRCDVLVLYLDGAEKIGTGSSCELGAALVLNKPVFMYGKQMQPESPFLQHRNICSIRPDINELLAALERS